MGNRAASYNRSVGTYTVVRNDTLWWICTDLKSQIENAAGKASGSMTVNQAMEWVANKNNIKVNNYLYVGQVLAIHAGSSSSSTDTSSVKKTNAPTIVYFGRGIPIPSDVETVDPATSGTDLSDRSLLAIWTWSKEQETAEYVFTWKYTNGLVDKNGDAIWLYENNSNSIDEEHKSDRHYLDEARQATWDLPEGATYAQFEVAAIARTKDVNGKETKLWADSDYAKSDLFNANNISLDPPDAPEVTMTGQLQMKCTLANVDAKGKKVQFEVWQNDSNRFASSVTTVSAVRTVTYSVTLAKSSSYRVRCRISNGVVWSNWSDYSDPAIKTVAEAPAITTLTVEPQNIGGQDSYVVNVGWTKRETATEYDLEYILKEVCTGIAQDGSFLPTGTAQQLQFTVNEQQGVHPTATTLPSSTFQSSGAYYLHMRSKTGEIYSDWSSTKTITVGTRPDAPTTWSSSTTTIIDQDELRFFWMHNSTDGSPERKALLYYRFGRAPITAGGDVEWDAWSSAITINNNRTGRKRYELSEAQILLSNSGTEQYEQNDNGPARIRLARQEGQTYLQWAMRTYGAYIDTRDVPTSEKEDFSPVSTRRIIRLFSQPSVVFALYQYVEISEMEIYANIDSITSFPFYLTATNATTDQSPISFYVKVSPDETYNDIDIYGNTITILAGDPVYETIIGKDAFEEDPELGSGAYRFKFDVDNLSLKDNINYSFVVEMTTDAGLKATYEAIVPTDFEDVSLFPDAELAADMKMLTMSIKPYCTDEDDIILNSVYLWVYRREFDGSFVSLTDRLDAEEGLFVVDPHPALNYARYRIYARDKTTGQSAWYDLPGYPIGVPEIIIQWDEEWQSFTNESEDPLYNPEYKGSMVRLPYNIDISESTDRDIALVDYIGRENPVSYYGTKIGVAGSWSTEIPKSDTDTLYALRRLSRWMGNCYVREPSGIGYWAVVKVSFSQTHKEVTIPVTIDVTKVEGGI